MDWLSQNWLWIFLVVAMIWLMRRGGMGCGGGHHGKHLQSEDNRPEGKKNNQQEAEHRHHC
ncbi:MAG: hypothetical protein KGI82_00145 [Betaproteobacteria bacterium]|nr:hypothetical protein [Betaproteobacteria bacterium]